MTSDRLQAAVEAVFNAQLDRLKFYIFWEYQVESSSSGGSPVVVTCELTSVDPTMPNAKVTLRPGPDGSISTPATGSTVLVGFAGGDPSKPYIFATDPNSPPTHVWIAGGGSAVGRVGDAVHVSADITGTVSGGTCTITASTFNALATIAAGSNKVESG